MDAMFFRFYPGKEFQRVTINGELGIGSAGWGNPEIGRISNGNEPCPPFF